ncbi:hypothetical protein CHS0354_041739 [Potamilus streckersoni]|uniref:La-related protein 7 n=1 Tax=Potamilus streckersoni TaxID=2493646 RepID=A0AAE0T112_9BIVA|nr:hypothetical protein CHS0354_041739 [Potamilus streckersoni]
METDKMEKPVLSQKPVRKRMKAIYKKIREQMEFYFSDANLHKDRFLKRKMEESADGYVDLSLFLTFNRIQALTVDVSVLAKAVSHSDFLQLSEDRSSVKRTSPISDPGNVDARTVYVECLPSSVDQDWIRKVFSDCGKIAYISIPRYRSTKDPKGFAFVEFETEEAALKACEELNNPPVEAEDKIGKFPHSNKQLEFLKKKGLLVESKEETITNLEKEPVTKDSEMRQIGENAEAIGTLGGKGSKRNKRRRKTSEGKDVKKVDGQEKASGPKDNSSTYQQNQTDKDRENTDYDPGESVGNFGKGEVCSVTGKKRKRDSESKEVESEYSKEMISKQTLSEQPSQKRIRSQSEESTAASGFIVKPKSDESEESKMNSGSINKSKSETSKISHLSPRNRKSLEQKEKNILSTENADSIKVGDIEKSGKKRSRKRKSRTRTDSGTETGKDSVEKKCDSVGSRESIEQLDRPAKMQRKEEMKEDNGSSLKERRKKRRKRKKRNKDKYTPEIRVIPKVKWLELRKEYLELQKKSMRELKRALVELKQNVKEDEKTEKNNKEGTQEVRAEKKTKPLEFVPDVIVKITSTNPMFRQQIKTDMTGLGEDVHVAYIDVKDETNEGVIRCKDSQSAQKISSAQLDKYTLVLLSGDEERAYWDKLAADRETKLNANRPKKRGHQRLLDRAQKARSVNMEKKHIIFGDEI